MDLLTVQHRANGLGWLLLLLLWPQLAWGQIFSPGELSRAHERWDNYSDCDQCHSANNRVDNKKCLACHKTLAKRIKAKKGYHAQGEPKAKPCYRCHIEHHGRDAALILWPKGGKKSFPHQETGWPLHGTHKQTTCEQCHDPRLIRAPNVRDYLKQEPGTVTQLGLGTACQDCHFDEHRGQLEDRCEQCHDEKAWTDSPLFHHEKSWPLEGAHARVACDRCHPTLVDSSPSTQTIPRPRATTYLKMKPLAHKQCTDCHEDSHHGRFGNDCLSCHNMENWEVDTTTKALDFHDRTAFPLKGRHRKTPCLRCHPADAKGKKHLAPIAHDTCNRCHPNAHPDIPTQEMDRLTCAKCHRETGFTPVNYGLEDHETSRYPLEEAHRAVSCPDCHLRTMGTPLPAHPRGKHQRGKLSSWILSPWRLRQPQKAWKEDCTLCHETPHREQFETQACTECHTGSSWLLGDSFNHETHTSYPLVGEHQLVACELCHPQETDKHGAFTRYTPIQTSCDTCHVDIHYGQFTSLQPSLSCESCHAPEGFSKLRFDHNDPKQSDFPLKGRHKNLECSLCHPELFLTKTISTIRYRPSPKHCEQCHEDEHRGAYAGVEANDEDEHRGAYAGVEANDLPRTTPLSALPQEKPTAQAADGWSAPPSWKIHAEGKEQTHCAACHDERDWKRAHFDHQDVGFPLRGLHKKVACVDCHTEGLQTELPKDCIGCHTDVHRGKLGTRCEQCHTEEGFTRIVMAASHHNRTGFPLTGRHAQVPCSECHRDLRDLGFDRVPTDCSGCHSQDRPLGSGTALDHSGFSRRCQSCHTTFDWKAAGFTDHERCFPIYTGPHAGIDCLGCHTGRLPAATGTCSSGGFSCTRCHGCEERRHRTVNGYECKEEKCYRCHSRVGQ